MTSHALRSGQGVLKPSSHGVRKSVSDCHMAGPVVEHYTPGLDPVRKHDAIKGVQIKARLYDHQIEPRTFQPPVNLPERPVGLLTPDICRPAC